MESVKDTFNCKQVFLDSKHLYKRYLSKDTSKDWSIQSFRHSFRTLLAGVEQNGAVIPKGKNKYKFTVSTAMEKQTDHGQDTKKYSLHVQ